jgi:hypothetical protein
MIGEISRKGVDGLYISEFACGIGATVIAEVALLIAYAAYISIQDRKNRRRRRGEK